MPSTNSHGPKRAILYARVSTEEQAEAVTLWHSRWKLLGTTLPEKDTRSSKR